MNTDVVVQVVSIALAVITVLLLRYLYRVFRNTRTSIMPSEISNLNIEPEPTRGGYRHVFNVTMQDGYMFGVKRYFFQGYFVAERKFNSNEIRGMLSFTEKDIFRRTAVKQLKTMGFMVYPYTFFDKEVAVEFSVPYP